MGVGHSSSLRSIDQEVDLLRETKDFARWTLAEVMHLHERFQKTCGFAVTESQFEDLLLLKAPETVSLKEIFHVLDTNKDGRIDGLEFLGALVCCCRATFEDKARFAFELFDFNMNGSLSVTELALLLKSVWIGMSLLTGGHKRSKNSSNHGHTSLSVHVFLNLSKNAFMRYDKDGSEALNYEEFVEWARSNREFMLQVEHFRLISEKAIGFEEEASIPGDSDVDSDVEIEVGTLNSTASSLDNQKEEFFSSIEESFLRDPEITTCTSFSSSNNALNTCATATTTTTAVPTTSGLLPEPWMIEPSSTSATAVTSAHDLPPPINMELDWMYGARGGDIRRSSRFLASGDVVYFVSKHAIIYSSQTHRQRYYKGHTQEIVCMDIHPNGEIVATGSTTSKLGKKNRPEIHLWHANTLQCLAILKSFHVDGISHLAFAQNGDGHIGPNSSSSSSSSSSTSSSGVFFNATTLGSNNSNVRGGSNHLLASVGSDSNSLMALWDWQNEVLIASGRAVTNPCTQKVLALALKENGTEIITCGKHFIAFHQVEGRFFKKKKAKLNGKLQTMPICLSIAYFGIYNSTKITTLLTNDTFIHHKDSNTTSITTTSSTSSTTTSTSGGGSGGNSTTSTTSTTSSGSSCSSGSNSSSSSSSSGNSVVIGTSQGSFLQFVDHSLVKIVQHAHLESINVLFVSCRNMILFSGGKDGYIKQWDSTLACIGFPIDLHHAFHQHKHQDRVKNENDDDVRISSLDYEMFTNRFLIGTRNGDIIELQELEQYQSEEEEEEEHFEHFEEEEEEDNDNDNDNDKYTQSKLNWKQRKTNHTNIQPKQKEQGFHVFKIASSVSTITNSLLPNGERSPHVLIDLTMATNGTSEFASCGQDKCVRIWSLRRRIQVRATTMRFMPSFLTYSKHAQFLAVGGIDGSIAILHSKSLLPLAFIKNTHSAVTCMRFGPSEEEILAVACANGFIYLYTLKVHATSIGMKRFALLKPTQEERDLADAIGNGSAISLDFSIDGKFLKSQHGSKDLRFWDLRGGQGACSRIFVMHLIRDVRWQTYTSTIGWHVGGLKEGKRGGINTDEKIINVAVSDDRQLVATLKADGSIGMTHFPCIQGRTSLEKVFPQVHLIGKNASSNNGRGIVGDFALRDTIFISGGLEDGVICQWRIKKEEIDEQPRQHVWNSATFATDTGKTSSDLKQQRLKALEMEHLSLELQEAKYLTPISFSNSRKTIASGIPNIASTFSTAGKASMSGKQHTEAPDLDLNISYVYGMSLDRVCGNSGGILFATHYTGDVVYTCGAMGIVYNLHQKKQRFYLSHTTTISAMTLHPNHKILATASGQKICVWEAHKLQTLCTMNQSDSDTAIVSLAFDTGLSGSHSTAKFSNTSASTSVTANDATRGQYLAAICSSRIHWFVRFYNWPKQKLVVQAEASCLPVIFGEFYTPSRSHHTVKKYLHFVSGGVDHVTFWRLEVASNALESQSGLFGRHAIVQTQLCGLFFDPYFITGTEDGSLVLWEGFHAAATIRIQEKTLVVSLQKVPQRNLLLVGLNAGQIVFFRYDSNNNSSTSSSIKPMDFLTRLHAVDLMNGSEWKFIVSNVTGAVALSTSTSTLVGSQGIAAEPSMGVATIIRKDKDRAMECSLKTLCIQDQSILAVMSTGDVLEIDLTSALQQSSPVSSLTCIMCFHTGSPLNAIATHPQKDRFVSVGEDGNIFLWTLLNGSAGSRGLINYRAMESGQSVKQVAFQGNLHGSHLALGLSNGKILFVNENTLENCMELEKCGAKNSSKTTTNSACSSSWPTCMRYSPQGDQLAITSHDLCIYVYKWKSASEKEGQYELQHILQGHTQVIQSLDFSSDGFSLQSSSPAGMEMLVWNLQTGTPSLVPPFSSNSSSTPTQASSTLPVATSPWCTYTNTFAGSVEGLLTHANQHGFISCLDRLRSSNSIIGAEWTSPLPTVAFGNEHGDLALSWYPIPYTGTNNNSLLCKEFPHAHPNCIQNVSFSNGNNFLLTSSSASAGVNHSSFTPMVIVWETDYAEEIAQLQRASKPFTSGENHLQQKNPKHPHPQATKQNAIGTPDPEDNTDTEEDDEVDSFLSKEASTNPHFLKRKALSLDPFASKNGGDEFTAVKPWLGAIREPTSYHLKTNAQEKQEALNASIPPKQSLELDFVYGYRGFDMRNNVLYADDTWEIVYHAAATGIVFNTKKQTQLFNHAHDDDILSIAVHPAGHTIATGDIGKKPKIVLWDANSGSTIASLGNVHERGICQVTFNDSGSLLASIGMDNDHTLALYHVGFVGATGNLSGGNGGSGGSDGSGFSGGGSYGGGGHAGSGSRSVYGVSVDAKNGLKLITTIKTSKQQVLSLSFREEELVTCGVKHILFWRFDRQALSASSSSIIMKKGIFGQGSGADMNATIVSAVFFLNDVISAQADGSLYRWKGRNCSFIQPKAHTGPINCLYVDKNTNSRSHKKTVQLLSGGKDGFVRVWNSNLELVHAFDLTQSMVQAKMSFCDLAIRSLCSRDGRLLIGTQGCDIMEVFDWMSQAHDGISSAIAPRINVHMRGHSKGELWALDAHPNKIQFVTAGDDGCLRLWDSPTRTLLGLFKIKDTKGKARAIAFSPDGRHLAIGLLDGNLMILSESLDTIVVEVKCSSKQIQVLKYSPDGKTLAIGCHDQKIHLFDALSYKKRGECKGHSSTITHLDFSKDSKVLQSNSAAYELLFWEVTNGKQITSSNAVRDVAWETWTCTMGWPSQGIWPPSADGTDINAVCRSSDQQVLASVDDNGQVKLFRYPCTNPKAKYHTYKGHSSHVTNCTFTKKDMYLLTTGGLDNAIFQFKYVVPPSL